MRRLFLTLLLLAAAPMAPRAADLAWLHAESEAFARAQREHRFVLLYLEAVWCHWCHVMDHETYADPAVRKVLQAHYVGLRIDQDARPDLANRYREYGWPATIVFAPDGTELVKRQGYIPAPAMARLLAATVRDPSPEALAEAEPAPATSAVLSEATRAKLRQRHHDSYDEALGGLATAQKYLERDSVEYALVLAADGDETERRRATQTLDAAHALLDPAWGGVYQYSTNGDWQHPHYEKLATLQGEYLRLYSLAQAQTREPRYLADAHALQGYLRSFLRDDGGGYYVSQDADLRPGEHSALYFARNDADRRRLGVPRVDRHLYARETGVVAEGLAALYEAAGDSTALADAEAGVAWANAERSLPGGGFRHDAADAAGPYLGDTLAMSRALLQLYRATGKRDYLQRSAAALDFIAAHFRADRGYAASVRRNSPIAPQAQIDENISLARHANLLSHYTGQDAHRAVAAHALAWLAMPSVALSRLTEAGTLLLDRESASEPLHLTVVGTKDDAQAAALFQAALRVPGYYKRVEWWDRGEGALPNADVEYPPLKRAAAFVCTDRRCSVPLAKPEDIAAFLAESRAAAVRSASGP